MATYADSKAITSRGRRSRLVLASLLAALLCLSSLVGCFPQQKEGSGTGTDAGLVEPGSVKEPGQSRGSGDTVTVSFLSVGEGDSILITSRDMSMLIDGGNVEDGIEIAHYLQDRGIKKLDYVVATHPHEDHIGGLIGVLENYEVGTVYQSAYQPDKETYRDFEYALGQNGADVLTPTIGASLTMGDCMFKVLANGSQTELACSEDADENGSSMYNNSSIVLRMDVGEDSFLFMGDAEYTLDDILMEERMPLDVDVLKVGHHGSSDATKSRFLSEVSPQVAVIEVGAGNDYGFPKKNVLTALENAGCTTIYRTDTDGTITATTSGVGIDWTTGGESLDGNDR